MKVLSYTNEDVCNVRRIFNKEGESIKTDVAILRNWLQQQRHLPHNQGDGFLERILLRNKFRIEQTKKKLDNYYSLRGTYKEFYQESNREFIPSQEENIILPLPRLTPNLERILFMKISETIHDSDENLFLRFIKCFTLLEEILMREDYAVGDVVLFDFKHAKIDHIKRITVAALSKLYKLYHDAYSGRIMSLYIINAPSYTGTMMGMIKLVVPAKIFSRMVVSNDSEILYKILPKECLPKDYGGDLESFTELREKWNIVFEEHVKFFDENYHNVSNENLRVGELPLNAEFGVDGTFKKLNLD